MKLKGFLSMKIILILIFIISSYSNISAQDNYNKWTKIIGKVNSRGERWIIPQKYETIGTNFDDLKTYINNAPFEHISGSLILPFTIELPMPDGRYSKFYIYEYSMMEPELAQQFPEMKTYSIKGIDDPYATGKLDVTILGFHAMVLTVNGDYYIDPFSTNDNNTYISYYKSDLIPTRQFQCLVSQQSEKDLRNQMNEFLTGESLRIYRLACAATGEYTDFFGGTVAQGQAAIVTAINRVNGVYERDLSLRMILVANNLNLVYTNGATDPYTNNDGNIMLSQNQNNIDNLIGTANYDIGHVFSTAGGGVAGLGVVCSSVNKARGVTGSESPVGDGFYINYVAHEMGHQFGANHTFNSITGSCSGNRNASTAWEPGSGSTIMAYAGICGVNDLQPNSDDYFHSGSASEIAVYTQVGNGNSCPISTNTGNSSPAVTVPADGFTIPISTPFQLTGSATDAETPGSLSYCWEEFDVGPAGTPNSPSGNAPIFRSFSPVNSGSRTFPKVSDLINNTHTVGELLPTYSRSLNFRLTVRDNNAGGGGIGFNTLSFDVSSASGPFIVTSPNSNLTLNYALPQTVTWNVANTNTTPVNCNNVNILLSTNGGVTFPTTLISNTPNDGSESVNLPGINNSMARIKVESVGNIFFDISNVNFTILNSNIESKLTGGNWNDTNSWVGNVIPTANDNVIINGIVSVTYNADCNNISITDTLQNVQEGSGSYRTLTVNGNIINNGLIQSVGCYGCYYPDALRLDVKGDMTNNGIWQPAETRLIGNTSQYLNVASDKNFGGTVTNMDTIRPIIPSTNLTFSGTFNLNNGKILAGNKSLYLGTVTNGRIDSGNIYNGILDNITCTGKNVFNNVLLKYVTINEDTRFYGGALYKNVNCLSNVQILKTVSIGDAVFVNSIVTITDTLQNVQEGLGRYRTLTVNGNIINNGLIQSVGCYGCYYPDALRLDVKGNMTNNGIWQPGDTRLLYNSSSEKTISLKNSTSSNITIDSSKITGADAGNFTITSGGGNVVIAPGATHVLEVMFTGNGNILRNANLNIFCNQIGTLNNISLQGTGSGQSLSLNLKAFLEGFYSTGSTSDHIFNSKVISDIKSVKKEVKGSKNNIKYDNNYSDNLLNNVQDSIAVYLALNSSPFTIVDSTKSILSDSGIANCNFSNVSDGNYFIIIQHRNHIETWSSTAVTFTSGSNVNYDFTSSQSQALGNNLVQIGNEWCLFSGDVNQDGLIELTDLLFIYNDVSNFSSGYLVTDINGDNYTDLTDLLIAFNNSVKFIAKITP